MKTLYETQTSYIFIDDETQEFLRIPIENGNPTGVAYDFIGDFSNYSSYEVLTDDVGSYMMVTFRDGRWYKSSDFAVPPVELG